MSFRRYANTDEQEEALALLEDWSKRANWKLRFGRGIGRSPQTVIFDHDYQDSAVYVNDEGRIKVHGRVVEDYEGFAKAINKDEFEDDEDEEDETA